LKKERLKIASDGSLAGLEDRIDSFQNLPESSKPMIKKIKKFKLPLRASTVIHEICKNPAASNETDHLDNEDVDNEEHPVIFNHERVSPKVDEESSKSQKAQEIGHDTNDTFIPLEHLGRNNHVYSNSEAHESSTNTSTETVTFFAVYFN
jgi:hypothetical protein